VAELTNKLSLDVKDFLKGVKQAERASEGLGQAGEEALKSVAEAAKNAGQTIQDSFVEGFASLPSIVSGAVSSLAAGLTLEGITSTISGIVGGFDNVLNTGRDLITAQGDLQAKTGLVGAEFEKLKQQATEAYKLGVGESVAEANKIIGQTQQLLGDALDPDELGKFTARAQALGNLYDKDVNEVIAKAAPFVKQFGLEGDKAFELISLGLRDGATSQDDLLDTLGEYSQLVSKAGFDAAEFVGIITAGTEAGIFNTDKLGDAIKEADIRLKAGDVSNTLKGLAEELPSVLSGSLGQIVANGEAGILSTKEVIQQYQAEVTKAFEAGDITEAQRAQLQVGLAGTPVEDIGQDKFAELWGTILDPAAVEAQAQQAGQSVDNALGQYLTFDALTRQFEVVFAEVSATIVSALSEVFAIFSDTIAPTLSRVGETLGNVFTNAYTVLQPILAAIGGAVIGTLVTAFQAVGEVLRVIVSNIETVQEAVFEAFAPIAEALGLVGESGEEAGSIIDTFKEILLVVGEVLKTVADIFIGAFKIAIEIAIVPLTLIADVAAAVIDWFKSLFSSTEDVSKAMEQSVPFLQQVRNVLDLIQRGAQGVVNIFKVVKDTIVDVVKAIANLDFKAVIDSLTGFGEKAGAAWDDAFKKEPVAEQTDELKKNEDQTKKNEKAADDLNKKLDKTKDKGKKAKDEIGKLTAELRKLQLEEQKAAEIEQANTIADATERQLAILVIERKYARIGLEEQLAAIKGNNREAELQREILNAKLLSLDRDFENRRSDVIAAANVKRFDQQIAIQKRTNEASKKLNEELISALEKQVSLGNVGAVANLLKANRVQIEDALSDSLDAITESTPEFKSGIEEIRRQLSEGLIDVDQARANADILRQTILERLLAIPGESNVFARQVQKLYKDAADQIQETEAAVLDSAEESRISRIGSDLLRNIELRVRELQKERDQILENTELTEAQREAIEEAFSEKIDEARRGSLRDFGTAVEEIIAAAESFTFEFDTEAAVQAAEEFKQKQEEINEQLRNGEISYQEAIDLLSQLESEASSTSSILGDVFLQALEQTAEVAREQVKLSIDAFNELRAEARKVASDETLTADQKREELLKINEKLAEQQTGIYEQIGIQAASAFVTAIASGEDAFKSLVVVALDALQALIPIFTAQIFGINAASPNPANAFSFSAAGIAAAAATTAILQGLVSAARASVAGFKDGGYTGNVGVNQVAGVVHGREFVVNAAATAKYRDVLEAMNNGKPLDLIAKDGNSGRYFDLNGGVNNMVSIMSDVRDRLDRIPDQAFMKQQIGVDLALDDRLYEKQRFIKQVRKLR
jgi:phage-related minor tail protein